MPFRLCIGFVIKTSVFTWLWPIIKLSIAEVDRQGGGVEEGKDTQVKGNSCGGLNGFIFLSLFTIAYITLKLIEFQLFNICMSP